MAGLTIFVSKFCCKWGDFFFTFPGSFSDYPAKQNFAMAPMQQLSPMALEHQPPPLPPHHVNGGMHGSVQGGHQMLDYLENQMRGLDVGPPQMGPRTVQNMHPLQARHQLQHQSAPPTVPYTPGPPSMLSALDEMGVRGVERRVITLPPIIQRVPSFSSRRGTGGGDGVRGAPRISSQSSGSSNPSGGGAYRDRRVYRDRDVSPPRRGILRDYSDDSDWDNWLGKAPHRGSKNGRGGWSGRRGGGSRPRTQSRDDLMDELHSRAARRERSYSPPQLRKGSFSDEDDSRRRKGGKAKDWPEKPPSYSSIEMGPGQSSGRRNYDRLSVRATHKHWHTLNQSSAGRFSVCHCFLFPFPFSFIVLTSSFQHILATLVE